MTNSMKPGGGGRFRKLSEQLARKGVRDPKAVAASIGRKKWGAERMESWAEKGKARHEA